MGKKSAHQQQKSQLDFVKDADQSDTDDTASVASIESLDDEPPLTPMPSERPSPAGLSIDITKANLKKRKKEKARSPSPRPQISTSPRNGKNTASLVQSINMEPSQQKKSGSINARMARLATIRETLASKNRSSLLSSENSTNSYRGLMNLAILVLVISHLRLMIINLLKYGLLLDQFVAGALSFFVAPGRWPSLLVLLCFGLWLVAAYLIEKRIGSRVTRALNSFAAKKQSFFRARKTAKMAENGAPLRMPTFEWSADDKTAEKLSIIAHTLLITSLLVFTTAVVWVIRPHPLAGMALMMSMTILLLKLISYAVINHRLRSRTIEAAINSSQESNDTRVETPISDDEAEQSSVLKDEETGSLLYTYPQNIRLNNIFYFLVIPTLVYEENFPRTRKIRKAWLGRRLLEFVFFTFLLLFVGQQYIYPLVINAMPHFVTFNLIGIVERLLKLTVPMIALWLLMFYTVFHLYLNILAEITCYGDRQFYLDFWNSTTLAYFWRTWNIVTHRWLVSHIYIPMVNRKLSPAFASFMVFFVSALFHEIIVSIPFHTIKGWSFLAMMIQWPLCAITEKYFKGSTMGNIVFWFSFMFGQAQGLLFYFKDLVSLEDVAKAQADLQANRGFQPFDLQ